MTTKEKIIALIIGISVLFLVNLPIFYFYLFPKDNLVFLGRRIVNSQDTYTYVSFIEEAKQGKIIFDNLYTTQAQIPSLIRPSYIVIGKFASIFNISSTSAYHLSRLLLSIPLLIVLYKFLSLFFETSKKRLIAFTILLTSSGLGFILGGLIPGSTDLWIPEANTFLSLAESPHFILSQILMIEGFLLFLRFLEKKKLIYIFTSTVLFLFLSFEHPYNMFIIAPIIFLTSFFSNQKLFKSAFFASISSFGIIYQIWQAIANPILKSWQVKLISPSPTAYLAGFGFLIPFSIIGAEDFIRQNSIKHKFILIWLFVTAVMIYAPLDFQRRMIEGIHIPLVILTTTGLFTVAGRFKKQIRLLILYGTIFILSLSSFYIIFNDLNTIGKDSSQNYYYYISKSESEGITWLKNNTNESDGILSNWFFGNIIPGITGRKVYLGHKAQSGNFDQKVELLNSFLLNENIVTSVEFLKQNNINYIFIGNFDPLLSYGFKPDSKPFLKKVYSKGGVLIYKVKYNSP